MDAPLGPALMFIGVLFVAAAIAGGAKILGNEIAVVASRNRQLLLGAVGCALFAVGGYVVFVLPVFKITNASVTSDTPGGLRLSVACHLYRGNGDPPDTGTVEYRFVHNGLPLQTYRLEFSSQRARSLSLQVQVAKPISLPGLPTDRQDTMAIEVLAPNHYISTAASLSISC